jgi:MYXO-CTERM domain-containing protein
VLVGVAALLTASSAIASNERHDRTPVLWDGSSACTPSEITTPCMTLVDRSQDPILHVPYGLPKEDALTAPDEVADSRTHQFHAFCRGHHPRTTPPNWISPADVDAAVAMSIVEAGSVAAEDVLDTSTAWQDCWWRINADDERRPIVCEMADEGVDWDTTGVPAGAYVIEGFTNEPAANLWRTRPGVVKVHDGDPDAAGPAAAITTGELVVYRNDIEIIEGCVDAPEGTTYTVFYGIDRDGEVEWTEYAADLPVDGSTFEFELDPPEALIGEITVLRADFTDPQRRSSTAYMGVPISVFDLDNPTECEDGGGFIGGDHCNDTSSSGGDTQSGGSDATTTSAEESTGAATSGDGSTSSTPPADGPSEGCGCTHGAGRGLPLFAFVLALARRRRGSITSARA